MSDKFTFEYNDSRNDIKVKLTVDVTELAKKQNGSKVQGMALFKSDSEIWYKGKRYAPDEFQKFIYEDKENFKIEFDFGFGGAFNYFCASIGEMILAMANQGKNNPWFPPNMMM